MCGSGRCRLVPQPALCNLGGRWRLRMQQHALPRPLKRRRLAPGGCDAETAAVPSEQCPTARTAILEIHRHGRPRQQLARHDVVLIAPHGERTATHLGADGHKDDSVRSLLLGKQQPNHVHLGAGEEDRRPSLAGWRITHDASGDRTTHQLDEKCIRSTGNAAASRHIEDLRPQH